MKDLTFNQESLARLEKSVLAPDSWDSSGEILDYFKFLRQHDPVHWSEQDKAWLITTYDDLYFVSKRQDLFTSEQGVRIGTPKIGLIDEGEPRHTLLRKLLNKGFTPRMVSKLEEKFKGMTRETIDKVSQQNSCDFVKDIAVPLPLSVIAEMIGIPAEDHGKFHKWSDDMIAADGNEEDLEIMAKAGEAFVEYSTYVAQIIEERKVQPQDDLISILVTADDEGVLMTFNDQAENTISDEHQEMLNQEIYKLLVILMVAGNETTRNALSGGMALLIENPEEREKLIADPSLIPSAVEEMIRLVSPVQSFARTATQDFVLRGKEIKQGEKLLLIYPSANRDEAKYENADQFDVTRNPQHLGFGMGGHFCLGASLARMEMKVVFEELLNRLPDMTFEEGRKPEISPSALVRSCKEMRVSYTPAS